METKLCLRNSAEILVLVPHLCTKIWIRVRIDRSKTPLLICQSEWKEVRNALIPRSSSAGHIISRSLRIPECEKFLLVVSGILGFGIRNTAQNMRNSAIIVIRNPSTLADNLLSITLNLESTSWNPDFMTVLDSLTRDDWWTLCGHIPCGTKLLRVLIFAIYCTFFQRSAKTSSRE